MNYHFEIHQDPDGLWAECLELPGCLTQADSIETLKDSCKEALNLYLEEPNDSRMVFPLPDDTLDSNESLLGVRVEPEVALAVLLRSYRSNNNLTQKQAAKLLNMKNLYSYQRLEKKSNPTLTILKKIHSTFPGIKLDCLFQ